MLTAVTGHNISRSSTAISAIFATTNPSSDSNISHRSLHIKLISKPK